MKKPPGKKKVTARQRDDLLAMFGLKAVGGKPSASEVAKQAKDSLQQSPEERANRIGKTAAQHMLDAAVQAIHDPKALRKTAPVRGYLETIRKKLNGLGVVSGEQFRNASKAAGHEKYKATHCADTSTIFFALVSDSEDFVMPLIGGEPYLRHLLCCQHCLFMLAGYGKDMEDKQTQEAVVRETNAALPDLERLIKDKT